MEKALIILEKNQVIQRGHFVLTSGQHSNCYVNKDAIYPHTEDISSLCKLFADQFKQCQVEVVIAPALGGIILSQWTAHHLSKIMNQEVLAVYAEKTADGQGFVIKRGYDRLLQGKKVLVVEDILTTGGSVKKVIDLVRQLKGNIVGLAVICNRGNVCAADVSCPDKFISLVEIELSSWKEDDCPLCKNNIPINIDIGKGREYLARKNSGSAKS